MFCEDAYPALVRSEGIVAGCIELMFKIACFVLANLNWLLWYLRDSRRDGAACDIWRPV